jgi:hypothetical protein
MLIRRPLRDVAVGHQVARFPATRHTPTHLDRAAWLIDGGDRGALGTSGLWKHSPVPAEFKGTLTLGRLIRRSPV